MCTWSAAALCLAQSHAQAQEATAPDPGSAAEDPPPPPPPDSSPPPAPPGPAAAPPAPPASAAPAPPAADAAAPPAAPPAAQPAPPPPPPPYYHPDDPAAYAPEEPREPPRELPYYEGEPKPPGYVLVERRRRGLVIGGALTLGIPYAISVSVAAGGQYDDSTGWLLAPVVGPWITAGRLDDDCSDDGLDFDCNDYAGARTLLAMDGLAQAAGAVMLVVGIAFPKRLWVRDYTTEVSIAPVRLGRSGYGLGAVGSF